MNEYLKQAEEFLKKTNTELKITFLKYDKHFLDDKDKRDIYECTLKRGTRTYTFNFGQSINASGHGTFWGKNTGKGEYMGRQKIRVKTLSKDGKYKITPYFEGEVLNHGNYEKNKDFAEPNAYDILCCLTKSDPEDFKNFCANYGYEEDSIKALKVYEAVVKEYENLKMLFSDEELREMDEIQ